MKNYDRYCSSTFGFQCVRFEVKEMSLEDSYLWYFGVKFYFSYVAIMSRLSKKTKINTLSTMWIYPSHWHVSCKRFKNISYALILVRYYFNGV